MYIIIVLAGWLSHWLTLVRSSASDLSPPESILRLLVALERGSVEIKGVIPVDHTLIVRAY